MQIKCTCTYKKLIEIFIFYNIAVLHLVLLKQKSCIIIHTSDFVSKRYHFRINQNFVRNKIILVNHNNYQMKDG